MRLLLDTHCLVWFFSGSSLLPASIRQMLLSSHHEVYVSAASALELGEKFANGRWPNVGPLVADYPKLLQGGGFLHLPFTAEHALAAMRLPAVPGDLVNRLLAAQSLVEGMPIVSIDIRLDRFAVRRLWD